MAASRTVICLKTVRFWDAATGETLEANSNSITSVAFSSDGTQVVYGSDDKKVEGSLAPRCK
jgi:WD40 repeat protein